MAQQWKVEDLVQEMEHLEKLESKPKGQNIMSKMIDSLEHKMKSLPMTPSIIPKMIETIDGSKLASERKDRLLSVLDTLSGPSSNMRLTAAQQGIGSLSMYLSTSDWGKLHKATMTRDVLETLVRRLKTMGCVSLKEDVKAQAMGLLLHWMETKGIVAPGPWPLYYLVKDFSKLFISTKAKCEVGSLAAYPWNPLDLGEEWIKKAYGPNDQPECKDIPLAMYMDKVPLRVTSQLLKDKNMPPAAKASLVPTPQQGTAPVLCNAASLGLSNMCKFLLTGLCMFFFIFLPQFILRISRVLD